MKPIENRLWQKHMDVLKAAYYQTVWFSSVDSRSYYGKMVFPVFFCKKVFLKVCKRNYACSSKKSASICNAFFTFLRNSISGFRFPVNIWDNLSGEIFSFSDSCF